MTVLSVPIALKRPQYMQLPPHLESYSLSSHCLRDQIVKNAAVFTGHHDPADDWGGEEFSVNIIAHDGLPSVEIAMSMTPSRHIAKKIENCARVTRALAADKALDRKNTWKQDSRSTGLQSSDQESMVPDATAHASLCQVSPDAKETLNTLLKLMPGRRLSDAQMAQLAGVISRNHQVFARDSKDYGKVTERYSCHHSIETADAKPVHQKPYRHSRFEEDFLKALIAELKEAGLIRPSNSPWISPVVLVQKKDGGLRMCIDFRKLNAVTKRDPYQLPRIETLTNRMAGCSFFSNQDVLSAFWNVPMTEEDIGKTGFTTSFGNYEWTRMPFGLINASSTFKRLMDQVTIGLENASAYIDDVFVFSQTWEEHLSALDVTLSRLADAGLKCKLSKCSFGGDFCQMSWPACFSRRRHDR